MKKRNGGFYHSYDEPPRSAENGAGDEDALREKVDEYGKMSDGELLDELFAQAAAARRRGDLDDNKLKAFYDNVKGMLSGEQRRKLDVLMRALSENKQR